MDNGQMHPVAGVTSHEDCSFTHGVRVKWESSDTLSPKSCVNLGTWKQDVFALQCKQCSSNSSWKPCNLLRASPDQKLKVGGLAGHIVLE